MLLYIGIGALHGNDIWERSLLCLMIPRKRPPISIVSDIMWRNVQLFTLIQLICAFSVFAVANFTSVGYLCPLLLVVLVPFRSYILSRLFSDADLNRLDPHGEEEKQEDQQADEEKGTNAICSDENECNDISRYRHCQTSALNEDGDI